jgi:hypothetical protein
MHAYPEKDRILSTPPMIVRQERRATQIAATKFSFISSSYIYIHTQQVYTQHTAYVEETHGFKHMLV